MTANNEKTMSIVERYTESRIDYLGHRWEVTEMRRPRAGWKIININLGFPTKNSDSLAPYSFVCLHSEVVFANGGGSFLDVLASTGKKILDEYGEMTFEDYVARQEEIAEQSKDLIF